MTETERRKTLESLLTLATPLASLKQDLRKYEWDSDKELVWLNPGHLKKALTLFSNDLLTRQEIEEWANLIEGRDDIGVDSESADLVTELLHELANPTLTAELTKVVAASWLRRLEPW